MSSDYPWYDPSFPLVKELEPYALHAVQMETFNRLYRLRPGLIGSGKVDVSSLLESPDEQRRWLRTVATELDEQHWLQTVATERVVQTISTHYGKDQKCTIKTL